MIVQQLDRPRSPNGNSSRSARSPRDTIDAGLCSPAITKTPWRRSGRSCSARGWTARPRTSSALDLAADRLAQVNARPGRGGPAARPRARRWPCWTAIRGQDPAAGCWPSARPPTRSWCSGPSAAASTTTSTRPISRPSSRPPWRGWRAELAAQPSEAGRMIAVLAPSGGSGSSTLAVNVATVLAKEHKSAALIDLKLQAGDLAALLDLKPTYTLADLCQNVDADGPGPLRAVAGPARQRGPPAGPARAPSPTSATSRPRGSHQALDPGPRRRSPTWWSTSTTRSAPSRSRCSARPT